MATHEYADVEDYQRLTGVLVSEAETPHVQALLDTASSLVALYLREPCATEAAVKYADILAAMVCFRVYRLQTIPEGIASESVGSGSVSYVTSNGSTSGLTTTERTVLDQMCGRTASGSGITSVSFAALANPQGA
jgi:hypothetical protein